MSNSSKAYYEQCLFLGISTDFIVDYRSLYMSMVVINALIALPTMFGNLVIILGIWITPSLQTVSNLLLIGLACSDLGVGLIVPPLNIARNLLKLQNKSWCEVQVAYTFFGVMFCGVSFLTVAAFTIDKYLALHWHLRYVAIVTTRRVVYILVSFWFIFGAMSTIQLWSMTAYRISVCVVIPVFLLGTSFTYMSIYRVLRRHNSQIQTQTKISAPNRANGEAHCLNMSRYRKSVSSMFLVYCLFILCYIPYICVQFTILFTQLSFYASDTPIDGNNHTRLYLAVDITETVVIVNSFANPIIYCWRMREIRHAAKRIVMSLRFGTIVHPINESGTFTGTA
ncbi:adenosine receptor A2a [Exaiptasia diaphana]|uniref:G-protein coupled receptors family 1 profile domain-containing protein n=1 Tax=Exaiptasia diaphana TaxID=2652724 RepID=A0A913XMT0_EXADI|nr:adenosine receptor A2a [Exaiptasia diaphana]